MSAGFHCITCDGPCRGIEFGPPVLRPVAAIRAEIVRLQARLEALMEELEASEAEPAEEAMVWWEPPVVQLPPIDLTAADSALARGRELIEPIEEPPEITS